MKKLQPGTYLFKYVYQGMEWGFRMYAESIEDAERRVEAMQSSLVVDGIFEQDIEFWECEGPFDDFVNTEMKW